MNWNVDTDQVSLFLQLHGIDLSENKVGHVHLCFQVYVVSLVKDVCSKTSSDRLNNYVSSKRKWNLCLPVNTFDGL